MSRKYASRIALIPDIPRPSYMLQHPVEDGRLVHHSPPPTYNNGGLELEFVEHLIQGRHPERLDYASVDAARELEESVLGAAPTSGRPSHKDGRKRAATSGLSDASSDFDVPSESRRNGDVVQSKKRKLEADDDITEELERSIAGDEPQSISAAISRKSSVAKGKGRGRMTPVPAASELSMGKIRKKPGPKKKGDLFTLRMQELGPPSSAAGSIAGDMTPAPSVPPSPALSATMIYEIGNVVPPLKRAKRVDEMTMQKRIHVLEEAQRKVWLNIARRDVAKVYKYHLLGFQARQTLRARTAVLASNAAKKPLLRTVKAAKDTQVKAKRLMREMLVFWKKNEKEERDLRKRAEKEADNRAKEEEERREAARQARKLEFLISQTELYSHFVGNKLKSIGFRKFSVCFKYANTCIYSCRLGR